MIIVLIHARRPYWLSNAGDSASMSALSKNIRGRATEPHCSMRTILCPLDRARRRENIGDRPNDAPIENWYALRREILPQADAQLGCRVQELFKVRIAPVGRSCSTMTVQARTGIAQA